MPLNRVDPKNRLLLGPCPCEQQAAHIRNRTVDALEDGDVGLLAYRYLQNRAGERHTRALAMGYALVPTLWVHAVPGLGNTGRYRKSKRAARAPLIGALGADGVQALRTLPSGRDPQGIVRLLRERQVDTHELEAFLEARAARQAAEAAAKPASAGLFSRRRR